MNMSEEEILSEGPEGLAKLLASIHGHIAEFKENVVSLTSADEMMLIKSLYVFRKMIIQSQDQTINSLMEYYKGIDICIFENMVHMSNLGRAMACSYCRLIDLDPSTWYDVPYPMARIKGARMSDILLTGMLSFTTNFVDPL